MSLQPEQAVYRPEHAEPPTATPALEFSVVSGAHRHLSAAPTMVFMLSVTEPEAHRIYTIALTSQIQIDVARRGYDPPTRERLAEILGAAGATTQSLMWARVDTSVPSFLGTTVIELHVPCTFDLELVTAKYFDAIEDGDVPLSFHFNGTVFYRNAEGVMQVVPIPWTATAKFDLPAAAWHTMIDEHYPSSAFVRLDRATLAALQTRRAARGLPSFDACLLELLEDRDAG
jgi:hypothetical protein